MGTGVPLDDQVRHCPLGWVRPGVGGRAEALSVVDHPGTGFGLRGVRAWSWKRFVSYPAAIKQDQGNMQWAGFKAEGNRGEGELHGKFVEEGRNRGTYRKGLNGGNGSSTYLFYAEHVNLGALNVFKVW